MSAGSGSSGNSFFLEIGGKRLLIDLGLNTKTITRALGEAGIYPADIDAVFITHTHSDHVSAVPVIKKRLSCTYYMSELSYSNLFLPETEVITPGRRIRLSETLSVIAAETSHDCPGSLCYRFDSEEGSFGYATDLGYVSDEIRELMKGVKSLVLECNHDTKMLREGSYPFPLKRRILSDGGHLSNDACAEAACYFSENGTENIYLAHLSRENNTPEKALEAVSNAVSGERTRIRVIGQYGCGIEEI